MEKNEEFVEEQEFLNGDELTADEFLSGEGNFIKSPEVGEAVEFVLKSIKKIPEKKVKNPTTGKNMDIRLSSVDYFYEFISDEGKALTVTSWQIVGKTKAILKKLGGYGHTLKIEHMADGRTAPKDVEVWKVYAEVDGTFKELNKETNEWI